jgi:hypothetical protein
MILYSCGWIYLEDISYGCMKDNEDIRAANLMNPVYSMRLISIYRVVHSLLSTRDKN